MTDLNSLFLTLYTLLHAILHHSAATKRLRQTLATCLAAAYSKAFKQKVRATGPERALGHLRALTYTQQDHLHEDAAAEQFPLPERAYAGVALPVLFKQFGETIAQIIEHTDVAESVSASLASIPAALQGSFAHADSAAADRIAARLILPACLNVLAGVDEFDTPNSSTVYAPEVEERRGYYERLAECLLFMTECESQHVQPLLDVAGPNEGDRDHFGNAIQNHLHVLCCDLLDWWDGRTLRKFYAEMRLWADHLKYEAEHPAEATQAAEGTA
jgi:hypothetical protein